MNEKRQLKSVVPLFRESGSKEASSGGARREEGLKKVDLGMARNLED